MKPIIIIDFGGKYCHLKLFEQFAEYFFLLILTQVLIGQNILNKKCLKSLILIF